MWDTVAFSCFTSIQCFGVVSGFVRDPFEAERSCSSVLSGSVGLTVLQTDPATQDGVGVGGGNGEVCGHAAGRLISNRCVCLLLEGHRRT